MPQQTTEHGWTIPVPYSKSDEDTDQWGEILETFFDNELDPEVVIKDTRANQPAAGVEGRWMVITDDTPRPSLEYDDGSSWVTIMDGTATFIQADGSVPMSGDFDVARHSVSGSAGTLNYSGSSLTAETLGDGTGVFQVYDTALAAHTLRVFENGPVDVQNVDLQNRGSPVLTTADEEGLKTRQAEIPLTEIPDGDTAVGLRKHIPSGRTLRVYEVGVQNASGSTVSGLSTEVYDDTNATMVASGSSKFKSGNPIASKAGAFDVSFRVANSSGGPEDASGFVEYTME